MNTYANKIPENKTQQQKNNFFKRKNKDEQSFQTFDNSQEATYLRKLQNIANNNPQSSGLKALQKIANNSHKNQLTKPLKTTANNQASQQHSEKKENKTGLPNDLKAGIENLSGYAMDDVKVHFNSNKPKQFKAHAFARGTEIHLSSGQEKHLPHEAWHVVQQKQGRVKSGFQMKEDNIINEDPKLEIEADLFGAKALQNQNIQSSSVTKNNNSNLPGTNAIQLKAEVKITEKGLQLGREHDLKRYIEESFLTAEKGDTESEMKKQNTYRHMDSQATRRKGMENVINYYLSGNETIAGAQEICRDIQERVDLWEESIESEGGQFLGNSSRNTAISSEYDSMVLELLIQEREVTKEAVIHDCSMNVRNTAFQIMGDNTENISELEMMIKGQEPEEQTLLEILSIVRIGLEKSIDLTAQKLINSKTVKVKNIDKLRDMTVEILMEELSGNFLFYINGPFMETINKTFAVMN